jgi:hypothetical protein
MSYQVGDTLIANVDDNYLQLVKGDKYYIASKDPSGDFLINPAPSTKGTCWSLSDINISKFFDKAAQSSIAQPNTWNPPGLRDPYKEFEVIVKPKCTCGSAAIGSEMHSSWCDKTPGRQSA